MACIEPKTARLKNGKQVCIRTPVAEDTEKVLDYLKEVFADDRFFLTTTEEASQWQTVEKEREKIQTCYDDADKLFVVTEADGRIVSMSNIECGEKKRTRHVGDIGISILADWRSIGLGTAILQAMIDWATTHPVLEKLTLSVHSTNAPAIGLYQKLGFIEEGRRIKQFKFDDGHYEDGVLMARFVKEKER